MGTLTSDVVNLLKTIYPNSAETPSLVVRYNYLRYSQY